VKSSATPPEAELEHAAPVLCSKSSTVDGVPSDQSVKPCSEPNPEITYNQSGQVIASINGTSSTTNTLDADEANAKSLKIDKEVAKLKEAIQDASPEALHKLLRKEWRVFLYTPLEEDHLNYILRACLKNATPRVIEGAAKEILSKPEFRTNLLCQVLKHVPTDQFPEKIVKEIEDNFLQTATPNQFLHRLPKDTFLSLVDAILNQVEAEQVCKFVPKEVIDEVILHHLKVSPAKQVVNWLAKAGRLGYSEDDVIDEDDDEEMVLHPEPPRLDGIKDVLIREEAQYQTKTLFRDSLLDEQERNYEIQRQNLLVKRQQQDNRDDTLLPCSKCGFSAPSRGGQLYHAAKRICDKAPHPSAVTGICVNCGYHFTTKGGRQYHDAYKVCSSGKFTCDFPAAAPMRPTLSIPPHLPPQKTSAQVQGQTGQPPLTTPARAPGPVSTPASGSESSVAAIKAVDPSARVSPSQLSAVKQAELNHKLDAENLRYQNALAAINPQLPEEDQQKRRISLKNAHASKKSQIRASFGVTLRMREKDKVAMRTAGSGASHSSPLVHTSTKGFSPINRLSPNNSAPPTIQRAPILPQRPLHSQPLPPLTHSHPQPQNHNPSHMGYAPILPPKYSRPSNSSIQPPIRPSTDSTSNYLGFGMLASTNAPPAPPQSQNPQRQNNSFDPNLGGAGILPPTNLQHRTKRQRTSSVGEQTAPTPRIANWNTEMSHTQTPYGHLKSGASVGPSNTSSSLMVEVQAEDGATKYLPKKKVPVAAAQATWESLQPRLDSGSSESATEAESASTRLDKRKGRAIDGEPSEEAEPNAGGRANFNSRQEPIEIDSDSGSETDSSIPRNSSTHGGDSDNGGSRVKGSSFLPHHRTITELGGSIFQTPDADKPVPTTEHVGNNGASRPASSGTGRGGFMARRGGRVSSVSGR
jgi:hypothetical protein